MVEDVNAVGDVVDGDVEDEGAVEDVHPPTDALLQRDNARAAARGLAQSGLGCPTWDSPTWDTAHTHTHTRAHSYQPLSIINTY